MAAPRIEASEALAKGFPLFAPLGSCPRTLQTYLHATSKKARSVPLDHTQISSRKLHMNLQQEPLDDPNYVIRGKWWPLSAQAFRTKKKDNLASLSPTGTPPETAMLPLSTPKRKQVEACLKTFTVREKLMAALYAHMTHVQYVRALRFN